MLETFIVLNEKDIEKAKGKVERMAARGKEGRVDGKDKHPFLF